MAALGTKLRTQEGGKVAFWCPGCETAHAVGVGPSGWKFNDNGDRPTFTPSVLVTSGHYAGEKPDGRCWCTYNREHPDDPAPFKCYRCHSFVTDGRIQFLGDCSHALVGQTVDLPDFP